MSIIDAGDPKLLNSLLYVPATNDRFIASAARSATDAVILDLEDSIPESDKDAAVRRLPAIVPPLIAAGKQVFVRVNHQAERLDSEARVAVGAGATGLVVPKVEDPAVLEEIGVPAQVPGAPGRRVPIIALVETPRGILNADAIAAQEGVIALACGGEDLATAMNASPDDDVLRIPKILVHLAAKANHRMSLGLLQRIGSYRDLVALERAIVDARRFGFDGTTCIHPSAVPLINRVFRPSGEDLARARRLLEAADANAARGIGAFTFEGAFIDEAIVKRARRLLNS